MDVVGVWRGTYGSVEATAFSSPPACAPPAPSSLPAFLLACGPLAPSSLPACAPSVLPPARGPRPAAAPRRTPSRPTRRRRGPSRRRLTSFSYTSFLAFASMVSLNPRTSPRQQIAATATSEAFPPADDLQIPPTHRPAPLPTPRPSPASMPRGRSSLHSITVFVRHESVVRLLEFLGYRVEKMKYPLKYRRNILHLLLLPRHDALLLLKATFNVV